VVAQRDAKSILEDPNLAAMYFGGTATATSGPVPVLPVERPVELRAATTPDVS